MNDVIADDQRERDREESEASNPQAQDSTTAKTLTQQETEETAEWFDEQEARWSLRDQGRNPDRTGESFAERNV